MSTETSCLTTSRCSNNANGCNANIGKLDRCNLKGQKSCVAWLTGLSGAGKTTIARLVESHLHEMGLHTYMLDGDTVRHSLNKDLGFIAEDRIENIRRIAEVAKMMVDAGLIVIVAAISPFHAERRMARALFDDCEFIEIFVDAPLGVAEKRDPKGLYKKARLGEISHFTGIDSPYEAPTNPELRIDTAETTPLIAAHLVVDVLKNLSRIDRTTHTISPP